MAEETRHYNADLDDELCCPYSWTTTENAARESLNSSEAIVLSYLQTGFNTKYVNLGPVIGDKDVLVWTLYSSTDTENSDRVPIVLIHGLGSGLALWVKNLDALAQRFPVIAIDLPGFGSSSRPEFSTDPTEAELEFVAAIEIWRSKMGLQKMILVGHSFGGFLSFAYALSHPDRVDKLICADPWGFKERPKSPADCKYGFILSIGLKAVYNLPVNMFDILRLTGPTFLKWGRDDLISSFSDYIPDPSQIITNYIYHINNLNPTGEIAFKSMCLDVAWAKNPLILRIHDLHHSIPLTLIYGAKSIIDHYPAEEITRQREPAVTNSYSIADAKHHLYASNSGEFNTIILEVSSSPSA